MKTKLPFTMILILLVLMVFSFTSSSDKAEFSALKGFVAIPATSYYFSLDTVVSTKISIKSFQISETEVTNKQYNEFLTDLLKQGRIDDYKMAYPDTIAWKSEKYDLNVYVSFYHSSKATEDYPVVNISYEAANLFCDWLSIKYRKSGLISENMRFRLPSKEEWEYVAFFNPGSNYIPYLFNLNDKNGKQNCNYRKVDQESIFYNFETQNAEVSTGNNRTILGTPPQPLRVKSFSPNDFGLYDIFGNVAEMINTKSVAMGGGFNSFGGDIVGNSKMKYDKSSCEIGFRLVLSID